MRTTTSQKQSLEESSLRPWDGPEALVCRPAGSGRVFMGAEKGYRAHTHTQEHGGPLSAPHPPESSSKNKSSSYCVTLAGPDLSDVLDTSIHSKLKLQLKRPSLRNVFQLARDGRSGAPTVLPQTHLQRVFWLGEAKHVIKQLR